MAAIQLLSFLNYYNNDGFGAQYASTNIVGYATAPTNIQQGQFITFGNGCTPPEPKGLLAKLRSEIDGWHGNCLRS